jgi:hypothetical protein
MALACLAGPLLLAVTPGMGHQVTADGKILGEINDFFDKHLKGGPKPPSGKPAAAPAEKAGTRPAHRTDLKAN